MKKNYTKGFTLIELLAVIVVLGVVMVIAANAINSSGNDVNDKIYDSKIKNIEMAAVLYGQDNKQSVTITVETLAEAGYIVYDEIKDESNIVTDPRGKLDSLNNCTVAINFNAKKTTAVFNKNSCK